MVQVCEKSKLRIIPIALVGDFSIIQIGGLLDLGNPERPEILKNAEKIICREWASVNSQTTSSCLHHLSHPLHFRAAQSSTS